MEWKTDLIFVVCFNLVNGVGVRAATQIEKDRITYCGDNKSCMVAPCVRHLRRSKKNEFIAKKAQSSHAYVT